MRSSASSPLIDRSRVKVLVVDDEPHVRSLITRWLSDEGCDCAQARDADTACNYLEQNDVHLVTLDINMPGRSGIEILPQIKETCCDAEVIMLTADGDTNAAIEALTEGAYGYLIKPVEKTKLLLQVSKAIEHRQLLIERRRYAQTLEDTVRQQTLTIRRAHEETIHRLVSASMYRDEETGAHIRRVGLYSELLAEALGWPVTAVEQIRLAAPMHDVGKIGIPDAILQKPGKLTDEEFEVMKTHATIGASMLAGSESPMLQLAHEIALSHHERWDGTGYPQGLSGPFISESARIVAIVDVYDALSHDRVYRQTLPEGEVVSILSNGRGTHFDPLMLDLFLGLLPEMRRIALENPDDMIDDDVSDKTLIVPQMVSKRQPNEYMVTSKGRTRTRDEAVDT